MKNNKGFTLIELLAVIVVLAIVTVLATRSVLPFMSSARVDAFRIEASNVIKSAEDAVDLYTIQQIKLKNNTLSCIKDNVLCITVEELINLGLYDGDKESFSGKVLVNISNLKSPSYTLYFQKNSEFNINGGTEKDYVNNGTVNNGGWTSSNGQSVCSCN